MTWTKKIRIQQIETGSLSGSYFVQGGNSFGTTATLGTNDNQSLAFETSGSERWRITSGGIFQSSGSQTIQTSTGTLNVQATDGNLNLDYTGDNVATFRKNSLGYLQLQPGQISSINNPLELSAGGSITVLPSTNSGITLRTSGSQGISLNTTGSVGITLGTSGSSPILLIPS